MTEYNLQIHISNAKSDSGDIITAGTIFFKHPDLTQRNFYLMSLRRHLPPSTPFSIFAPCELHHKAKKYHISLYDVVPTTLDTLTDILSEYLNGGTNTTALFMGRKILTTMSHEESEQIYETHQLYVNSIQRLPLYPFVINIDRIRPSTHEGRLLNARHEIGCLRSEHMKVNR
jgi:hypothetical protein